MSRPVRKDPKRLSRPSEALPDPMWLLVVGVSLFIAGIVWMVQHDDWGWGAAMTFYGVVITAGWVWAIRHPNRWED